MFLKKKSFLFLYWLEFKEKICSELKMDNSDLRTNVNSVMFTDILPTEFHNDYLVGNVSSPKDECQETLKTLEKMVNITSDENCQW